MVEFTQPVMPGLRSARAADSSAINRLSICLAYEAVEEAEAKDRLQVLLRSDLDRVWVFEKENKVIGWIHVFVAQRVASAAFVEIGGIAVDPDYRHQGVGKAMVEQALKWAGKNNKKLRVRSNISREDAHNFYTSLGFIMTKSQHTFDLT